MTTGEDDASGMRGEMRAVQEKCCFANFEVPTDLLVVIELAERGKYLYCLLFW